MDVRVGDNGAKDIIGKSSDGIETSTTRRLSDLDESLSFGERWTCLRASNAQLTLRSHEGETAEVTDLSSCYGAVSFGHCNDDIRLPAQPMSDLVAAAYPPEAERFAQWLTGALDAPDFKVLFQIGGSFAVSSALALAQHRRPGKILTMEGGFHGLGIDALAVTSVHRSLALQETPLRQSLASNVETLAPGETDVDWSGISCLIFEPVQGAGGYVPLDRVWLKDLCASARAAGVTVIADEIQCGYFRFGEFSLSKAWDLDPDVVLFSKSMTNGLYPFSAVVYREGLEEGIGDGLVLVHTFQTAAAGCYAACAVADYIDARDIAAECRRVAAPLADAALRIKTSGRARDIHQIGPTLSFRPEIDADDLVKTCFADGVMILGGGKHGERIRIAPPMTIETDELRRAMGVVLENLGA